MYPLPQFPLINFYEPQVRRGKTSKTGRVDAATFSLCLDEDEIGEIRKKLATGLYDDVTVIEACEDGQVRRRYTVKDGKIVSGVRFSRIDYECRRPFPINIPAEAS